MKRSLKASASDFSSLGCVCVSVCVCVTCGNPQVELQINQRPGGALKTFGSIVAKEGPLGLWKGNALNLLRTAPYRSINYYTYDNTRAFILKITKERELSNLQRLLAGATAGCVAIAVCFPLDVLRTRMLSKGNESYYRKGVLSTLAHIVKGEGPLALYAGVIPALASVGPSNAVFYTVYDLLKTNHLNARRKVLEWNEPSKRARSAPPSPPSASSGTGTVAGRDASKEEGVMEAMDPRFNLLYGGLAGICAETSVYPLEVLRRRLQLIQAATRSGHFGSVRAFGNLSSMSKLLEIILKRDGFKGLYAGVLPTICQVLPSAAISYYIFELCKKRLEVYK